MKINLVSDATYHPVRIGGNKTTPQNKSVGETRQPDTISQFNKLLMEKLSPTEATAIRKLFGDFKTGPVDEPRSGPSGNGGTGYIARGKYVDITV